MSLLFPFKQLPDPATISDLEQKLDEAQRDASKLKEKLSQAEDELETTKTCLSRTQVEVTSLQDTQGDQKAANARLKEKLSRVEVRSNPHTHYLSVFSYA